jgi:hypothetical protein
MNYSVSEYGKHYTGVTLCLAPDGRDVYTFGRIGSGAPEEVWHRRHLQLASLPREVVGASLVEWLRKREDQLVRIAEGYDGTEWNGRNFVGRWSDDAQRLAELLDEELQEAVSCHDLATYWDAGEWMSADPYSVCQAALEAGSLDAAAAAEVARARDEGAHLDVADTREALEELLLAWRDGLVNDRDPVERLERLRLYVVAVAERELPGRGAAREQQS